MLTALLEGEAHPFRVAVMKNFPGRQEIDREPDLTPEAFWRVVGFLREEVRPFFVALAVLGCRSSELIQLKRQDLRPLTTSVAIRRRVKKTSGAFGCYRSTPTSILGSIEPFRGPLPVSGASG